MTANKRRRMERALVRWELDLSTNKLLHRVQYILSQIHILKKKLGYQ